MAKETGRRTGLCRTQTHGDFENLLWIERKHEICVALNPLLQLTETELNWIQLGAILLWSLSFSESLLPNEPCQTV
jgi:hypothetical protein